MSSAFAIGLCVLSMGRVRIDHPDVLLGPLFLVSAMELCDLIFWSFDPVHAIFHC